MQKRLITAEDLYQIKFAGSPSLSPDGQRVVYVLTRASEEMNGYYSSLFIGGVKEEPRPLTRPYHKDKLIRDTQPKWSPDGKTIAFLSNRSEKTQIWLLPLSGGEARQLTQSEEGVVDFNWSPDGNRIVFTAKEKTEEIEDNEIVTVITKFPYRTNGQGLMDNYIQVWIVDLETEESTRLTSGSYNHHSPSFAPSGDKIIYFASKDNSRHDQLYMYDLTSRTESILYEGKGPIADPAFSPDGQYVAFTAYEENVNRREQYANYRIWTVSTQNSEVRNLTASLDYFAGNFISTDGSYDESKRILKWSEDSESIVFLTTVGGNCVLKRVDLEGNVLDVADEPNSVTTSFDYANDVLTFVRGNQHSPGDVYMQTEKEIVQLSRHNEKFLVELDLSTPENFTYRGADDWEIEGWFLPPVNRKPGEKVPLVLQIHGGPQAAYGHIFSHEFQLLAAKGFAVLYTNPRGSQGYGHVFMKAGLGDWGNKDSEDMLRGLDFTLERYDYCDPNRVYVTGASYGGHMTNVLVTQTDRFRAAIPQVGSSNFYSFIGTSEMAFHFLPIQLGIKDMWEDEETLLRLSPIRYARNVKTPVCILHSEEDYRVPVEQGEEWYRALTHLGVETRFVRFKGENHHLSRRGRPKSRIRRLQEIVNWFSQHK